MGSLNSQFRRAVLNFKLTPNFTKKKQRKNIPKTKPSQSVGEILLANISLRHQPVGWGQKQQFPFRINKYRQSRWKVIEKRNTAGKIQTLGKSVSLISEAPQQQIILFCLDPFVLFDLCVCVCGCQNWITLWQSLPHCAIYLSQRTGSPCLDTIVLAACGQRSLCAAAKCCCCLLSLPPSLSFFFFLNLSFSFPMQGCVSALPNYSCFLLFCFFALYVMYFLFCLWLNGLVNICWSGVRSSWYHANYWLPARAGKIHSLARD